ncbi:MAG: TAXI family TRAP transporter solute-binding subunit [Bacillota bacterium]|nr:TAXI family TRAP transporter solute-binding subunit [Bacillota bacterium]MDW7684813.1 TAXI family TRAP transporter solute-binding subunit [Bacillota bacterium]
MRKTFVGLLILMLALSLIVAGCGGQQEPDGQENQNENQEGEVDEQTGPVRLLMATGGVGGTYYPLGGAMAKVWSENIDGVLVTVQSTGASIENIRLLATDETELAMAMNGPGQEAVNGGDNFPEPLTNFSAIGVIYPEVMQVIAPKGNGVEKIEDLIGKRVSIGPPGSGTAASAERILEAYGIDPDKDITKFQDNFADAADKLKDGQLDAAFAVLAVPAANVMEITTSTPVTVVDISGEGLDKLLEMEPAFSPYEIPGGTYEGQDDTAYTVSQWAVLYVQDDISEDVVYNLTKVMYENTDQIAAAHARGEQILLENAVKGIAPVKFHPGAARFYEEKGISID